LNNNNGTPTNNSGNSEKEYKMIKFGTNVDLSDEKKFSFQLKVFILIIFKFIIFRFFFNL